FFFQPEYGIPYTTMPRGLGDVYTTQKRGIALMMGGKFLPILDSETPTVFWNQGVKHYQLDTITFDAWQGKADKSTLDDATVDKLIKGLKK
ncbi:hypothetical protein, partial [Bacteroides stercoris]|uniref:hypothetical protein n=1 Tax=Bacteroides stercoris TaxID=46506 RepID=UPI0019604D39